MIKIVYTDDGRVKVVRGEFVDEDSLFYHIRTDDKEVSIAKSKVDRIEKIVKSN